MMFFIYFLLLNILNCGVFTRPPKLGFLIERRMVHEIWSGGQTGVDQAALFVGTEMGIPVGGWCPLGGLDENNKSILEKYPLKEVTGFSFEDSVAERTRRNIEDSDGTLIILPSLPMPKHITDGTLLTIDHAKEKRKPFLLVAVTESSSVITIRSWIRHHQIKILNVAGPRESRSPGIYDQSCKLLQKLFSLE